MRKYMIVSAALLAALGLSTSVFAQAPGPGADGPGWHHHRGGPFRHELRQLNLSDAQKASIKQIVQAARPQMRAQVEAVHQQRKAFETATPGTAAYQSAAAALAQAEATAASARVQEGAAVRTQIYAVLTDAQKAQLATLIQQREAKVAQWQAEHPAPAAPPLD
ncbi:MAG: hypothetical protein JWR16_2016 [Nevskia sp.]|nr:hypothetical protein [Nevskia sp.]